MIMIWGGGTADFVRDTYASGVLRGPEGVTGVHETHSRASMPFIAILNEALSVQSPAAHTTDRCGAVGVSASSRRGVLPYFDACTLSTVRSDWIRRFVLFFSQNVSDEYNGSPAWVYAPIVTQEHKQHLAPSVSLS